MKHFNAAALAVVLTGITLPFAEAETIATANQHNCAESTEASVTGFCRTDSTNGTIAMLDHIVIERIQSILKFDHERFGYVWQYTRWIEESRVLLEIFLSPNFEFNDSRSIFFSEPSQDEVTTAKSLISLFESFQVQHAGCNFTLEKAGDVQISRSFLIAYQLGDVQRFGVVHVEIGDPQKVHEQLPSERIPVILSFDVRVFAPGFPGSNEILRVHILPDPTEQCQQIINLMDVDAVNAVRELMVASDG